VVRGEAGIGKSVLLQRVRRRAEALGARPLVTVGVESEAESAFAGLHQLLRPVIGALAQLPESQRQTLEAALGLGVDLKPDSFRVAVAAFQLICEVADPAEPSPELPSCRMAPAGRASASSAKSLWTFSPRHRILDSYGSR
jgi:hypothetical protein